MATTDNPSAMSVWFHPSRWSREIGVLHSEVVRLELVASEKEELSRCMEQRLEESKGEIVRITKELGDVEVKLADTERKLRETEESLKYMASQNLELHKRVSDNASEIASLRDGLKEAESFDERLEELDAALGQVEQMKEKYEARIKTLRDLLAESRCTVEILSRGKENMPDKISMTAGESVADLEKGLKRKVDDEIPEVTRSAAEIQKESEDFKQKYPRKEKESDGWLNPLPDF